MENKKPIYPSISIKSWVVIEIKKEKKFLYFELLTFARIERNGLWYIMKYHLNRKEEKTKETNSEAIKLEMTNQAIFQIYWFQLFWIPDINYLDENQTSELQRLTPKVNK